MISLAMEDWGKSSSTHTIDVLFLIGLQCVEG